MESHGEARLDEVKEEDGNFFTGRVKKRNEGYVPVPFVETTRTIRKLKKISANASWQNKCSRGVRLKTRCSPHWQGGIFECHEDTDTLLAFFWLQHFSRR
jgi:hypothetical protein